MCFKFFHRSTVRNKQYLGTCAKKQVDQEKIRLNNQRTISPTNDE
jgi:hypothetical protein